MEYMALARAKINLAIDVLHRQADGYHQVAMILQSISLADRLTFGLRPKGISLTCTNPLLPCGGDNLVVKAARALEARVPVHRRRGAAIHLEKNIPLEAGLGGGSSDAAAALLALNSMWKVGLSREELQEAGFQLGADVPFCLQGGTALVQGLGERVEGLPAFPAMPLVLVKPAFGLSTARVYRSLSLETLRARPDLQGMVKALEQGRMERFFPLMANVLEEGAGAAKGEIDALKDDLRSAGARGVLMSGSGSTVFGFFNTSGDAARVAALFRERGFWSQESAVASEGVTLQAL